MGLSRPHPVSARRAAAGALLALAYRSLSNASPGGVEGPILSGLCYVKDCNPTVADQYPVERPKGSEILGTQINLLLHILPLPL